MVRRWWSRIFATEKASHKQEIKDLRDKFAQVKRIREEAESAHEQTIRIYRDDPAFKALSGEADFVEADRALSEFAENEKK